MSKYMVSMFAKESTIEQYAAAKLAAAQHAPGVTVRFNYLRYRVEYVNPDGSLVPGYDYFLRLAKEGKI